METLYHTGSRIQKINQFGTFGSFLFFSSERGAHYGDVEYAIEIDMDEIVDASALMYSEYCDEMKPIIAEAMELMDCDEDTAMEYLGEEINEMEDAEKSWEIQRLIAECAKAAGYRGVAVADEHGTSYMIDMFGNEKDLVEL